MVLSAMAAAIYGLGFDAARAVSVSFCTLAVAQLWHVFNMREAQSGGIRNEITRNPWIWAALAPCLVLIVAAVYLPPLAEILRLEDPGTSGWLLVIGLSVVPLLADPLVRRLSRLPANGSGQPG